MASKWIIFDWLKNWKTPSWLKILLQEIQDLLISIAISVGKDYLENLKNKIIAVSMEDISNEDKFKKVFNYGKYLIPTIKDSYLNMLVEILVNKLKKDRSI